jgi:hypothetical protein
MCKPDKRGSGTSVHFVWASTDGSSSLQIRASDVVGADNADFLDLGSFPIKTRLINSLWLNFFFRSAFPLPPGATK